MAGQKGLELARPCCFAVAEGAFRSQNLCWYSFWTRSPNYLFLFLFLRFRTPQHGVMIAAGKCNEVLALPDLSPNSAAGRWRQPQEYVIGYIFESTLYRISRTTHLRRPPSSFLTLTKLQPCLQGICRRCCNRASRTSACDSSALSFALPKCIPAALRCRPTSRMSFTFKEHHGMIQNTLRTSIPPHNLARQQFS